MTMRINVTVVALALGALALTGCSRESAAASNKVEHSKISDIPGSSLKRVSLSQHAQARLGIETALVKQASQAATGRPGLTVIPYSSVIYDVDGKSWAFRASTGGNYQRESVTIQDIDGPNAYLSSGPALSTEVVAVGAAELYGAELGVGK